MEHRCPHRARRLHIRHGRGIDPSVRRTGGSETPLRPSCGPQPGRALGHVPMETATDDGTRGARPARESPGHTDDPRVDAIRHPGASSSPDRERTYDTGSGTADGRSVRGRGPHTGSVSPWLGWTWARTSNRTTSRARDWTTGSFAASATPAGRYTAHDGFGRRTNSLVPYLRGALRQCKPPGFIPSHPGDAPAARVVEEASTGS